MHLRFCIGAAVATATLAALVACGSGSPAPYAAPPTSGATAVPQSVATTLPLGGGAALVAQPVATTVPAPVGYSVSVSAPLVSAGANTTVSVTAGATPPASVPVIDAHHRAAAVRRFVSGQYSAIYYNVVVPSQSITVSGNVSITQQFPAGTLTANTNYYLGFYDGTQASPTWQTISGPVTPSNNSLTFSGNVGSFTLQQNGTYAFCIFSVAASGATPPPSQAVDVAYLAQFTNGIQVVNASGTTLSTLSINSNAMSLDDSGAIYNMYNANPPSPAPGASPSYPPSVVQYYAPGSTTPTRTYNSFPSTNFIASSGSGELVTVMTTPDPTSGFLDTSVDVWNPGATGGAPSYTLSAVQNGSTNFDVQHDGTIYIGSYSPTNGTFSYSVYPPGATTPSRTIPETIVPADEQIAFAPNYMTVGPDGTLYVTEYSYTVGDPFAGLYIYPPSGPEKFVATDSNSQGAGPAGVDVDAAGNIYVANNNAGYDENTGNFDADTLQDIEVFSAGGASVLRHITGSFDPYPLVAAPDGTIFFGAFQFAGDVGNGTPGTYVVAPGATSATQISSQGETSIVLYNGYEESAALRHRNMSYSGGAAAAHQGAAAMRIYLQRMHHIR